MLAGFKLVPGHRLRRERGPDRDDPGPQPLGGDGVAVALSFGLIPAFQPAFYQHFPQNFQVIFGSSITSTVIVVFVLNLVFNHWKLFPRERESAVEMALEHGAIAPGADEPLVPDVLARPGHDPGPGG